MAADEEEPHPKPGPEPDPDVQDLANRTRGDYSSVVIDGKNITADSDTTTAADALRQLPRDIRIILCKVMEKALRESEMRKELWDNPLTRPPAGTDYGCHFVIRVNTKIGWVGEPEWRRCHDGECPENKRR
jgi:hypothetical protein